jgi:formate dehydrogenase iron-sulfur subunit
MIQIRPGVKYGFFTDTTLCIGCKACEVACKQWNVLPAEGFAFLGRSYDNTGELSATSWRHVRFVEQFSADRSEARWLMMSACCKHCTEAGCLEACPTGAIVRTEFGSVVVQQDVCNGCRYCVAACPFGVVAFNEASGTVAKCTLCSDRLRGGLQPACSAACPTASIQFGEVEELWQRARARQAHLHAQGRSRAALYGGPEVAGGLNVFYLLEDRPEVYGLPAAAALPQRRVVPDFVLTGIVALLLGVVLYATFL